MSKGIFVTGTGTDVGKTFVTGLLVKKLQEAGFSSGYYKAALSGAQVTEKGLLPGDAYYINESCGINEKMENLVSYVYENPVSPHFAAKLEGNPVELEVVIKAYKKAYQNYDYLTMEGSGGIVCPLRYDNIKIMLEDVIKELHLGTIVIADSGLGTINAVVLTVEYLKQKNIPVKGIIFNRYEEGNLMQKDNKEMVEVITGIPVLACVKENETQLNINADILMTLYE